MKFYKINSSQGSLGKNLGCEKAPDMILEGIDSITAKVVSNNIEETNKNIFNSVDEGFIVGGDHSITYSCVRKLATKYKNVGLVIFDAHPDCENDFRPPSHEDFVKVLVKDGIVKKENVILVGIRKIDVKERKFLNEERILCFDDKKLFNNTEEVCDVLMENCRKFDALYLSIDIDVLDPAFAPGTGYLEPGGMSSAELFYFLRRLKLLTNLKMIDLVEVNPDKDINGITVNTARKIVDELTLKG
ncbi:MAG: arginase family protein [Candidatus Nanoarchaeia archaeon]|nr:arginase family protein [Candidatus Nanoarchaeia archaeon]